MGHKSLVLVTTTGSCRGRDVTVRLKYGGVSLKCNTKNKKIRLQVDTHQAVFPGERTSGTHHAYGITGPSLRKHSCVNALQLELLCRQGPRNPSGDIPAAVLDRMRLLSQRLPFGTLGTKMQ